MKKLRTYQAVLTVLTISICGLIALGYGWQFLSTVTERAGFRGTVHQYYDLTKGEFAVYNLVVTSISLGLVLLQINHVFNNNPKKLTHTFWMFGLLVGMVVIAEVYLQTKFIPKG